MDQVELVQRVRALNGILPSEVIVEKIYGHDQALREAYWWRKVTSVLLIVVCLMFFLVCTVIMAYPKVPKDCVAPETVKVLMDTQEKILTINQSCLSFHERNKELYELMLTQQQ